MEESLKIALKMRRDGDLHASNQLLKELALQHPNHSKVQYECAWSYDILAKEEKAIIFYLQALELGLPDEEAVNAYAQLGSLYRLSDKLVEAEKLLMEGMRKFWHVGLLKVYYAFTLYDQGKTGEAMRWMTQALLDASADPEIVSNQRAIRYLGSNLDVTDIFTRNPFDVATANKTGEGKTLIEKVEAVLKEFAPTYFHGAWTFEFDRYEMHFSDSERETRRAAIAAFAMMVGIWETGSARPFIPQHERKYSGNYDPDFPHFELNGYIKAFYSNFNAIQMEFPVMTAYTIDALDKIDQKSKLGLEREFPEIESILFSEFRNDILLPNRKSTKKLPPFEDFLEEIGWNSSYRLW